MGNFETLLTNVIGMHLQAKSYSKIWEAIITDRSAFPALINSAGTEDEIIAFLDYYGPTESGEAIEGTDLSYACRELLPLAYAKQWYKLCGFIYGMGYYASFDPLCGSRNPVAYGAAERNPAFVEAFITGQKRFDYLSFDGERRCEDGRYRTLPEELVYIDCVEVVSLCLENGMNPNTFGFQGDRLLDVARSEEMRELLLAHGATVATTQERNLVSAVNELRHERLKRNTINAFFSTEPLLRLSWYNGSTEDSREQKADIFFEAARACHAELLEELYPLVQNNLDDKQRREVLRAILGQHYTLPCGRVLDERPVDIARSLEGLSSAGMRYGNNVFLSDVHPIIELIDCACWTFSFRDLTLIDTQLRIFIALWSIGGSPNGEVVIQALNKLAEEHPITPLEIFISRVKCANEEK